MSSFGSRVAIANAHIDAEFADAFTFTPMREVVNAMPEVDPGRPVATVRAILLQPGVALGSGWSGNAMHERASAEPTIYFMARGPLTDVRRFDRFTLTSSRHNPDFTGTRTYEVGDGPQPIGFGRYKAILVEISGLDVPPPSAEATPPF